MRRRQAHGQTAPGKNASGNISVSDKGRTRDKVATAIGLGSGLGPDYRHLCWRWPAYPRYSIYQVCSWVLGVRFGSDAAKRYEWKGGKITIYDKDNNIALEGSFAKLLGDLRRTKWPNYPWS